MPNTLRGFKWLTAVLIGFLLLAVAPPLPGALAAAFSVTYVRQWNSGGVGAFNAAHAVGFNPVYNYVYVADESNHRIQYFTAAGTYVGHWGGYGSGTSEFIDPGGIAVSADGTKVYVADRDNHRIQNFNQTGQYLGQWGAQGGGNGQFQQPAGVAVAPDYTVFVADRGNHRIQHFSATGAYLGQFGALGSGAGQLDRPYGVAVSLDGTELYVADAGNYRVQVFSAAGAYLRQWGGKGSADGQFTGYDPSPTGLAVGADGAVYVADSGQSLVQVFDAAGQFLGKWGGWGTGNGQFYFPNNVALGFNGAVYVGDELNNRVQQFAVVTGLTPPGPRNNSLYLPLVVR